MQSVLVECTTPDSLGPSLGLNRASNEPRVRAMPSLAFSSPNAFSGWSSDLRASGDGGSDAARGRIGWHLRQAENLLGALTFVRVDAAWVVCRFEATPAFASIRPLFEAELDLFDHYADWDTWETAYRQIADLELSLDPIQGGEPLQDFLLHVEGDTAWFKVFGSVRLQTGVSRHG
jgi:hypothetical protein